MMKTFKFRITESQRTKLNGDIVRFNKLADKLGCSRATLISSEAILASDPHHKVNMITDVSWNIPQVNFYDCELTGGFVVAGDYTFIGSIHYTRKNDEIDVISLGGDGIPDEYKNSLPICTHCNTKRQRKITFLMKSNIDDSIMQIGSTCLRDFLGYDVSDLMKALAFTMKFANVTTNYPHVESRAIKGNPVVRYGVREVLMLTNAVIRVFGWTGANSETHIPTADIVRQVCDTPESHEAEFWLSKINEAQKDLTDQNMASEVVKWAMDDSTRSSEYMYSLRSCIKGGTVTTRQFKLLCSAVSSFRNNIKRKLEAQSEHNNVFLGDIGDRLELEVKCIGTKVFEGWNGGETILYKMIDVDNHLLTWFSSSNLIIPDNRFMKIRGTVKKHETFNHANQTVLTRVAKVK